MVYLILLFLAIPVMGAAARAVEPAGAAKVVLRAMTESGTLTASAERTFTLEVTNLRNNTIAIAKPMFPNAWVVNRRYWDGSEWQTQERSGGAGPGQPSQGYPNKYADSKYVLLKPTETHRITQDLNWYLAFPDKTVLAGAYHVTFFYIYGPSSDESALPLLTDRLESNVLEVEVLPDP